MPVIESHLSPTFSSSTRSAPRPILVKVRILRLARERRELTYIGAHVLLHPNFSAELLKKQLQFDAVKNNLCAADIKCSLLYHVER